MEWSRRTALRGAIGLVVASLAACAVPPADAGERANRRRSPWVGKGDEGLGGRAAYTFELDSRITFCLEGLFGGCALVPGELNATLHVTGRLVPPAPTTPPDSSGAAPRPEADVVIESVAVIKDDGTWLRSEDELIVPASVLERVNPIGRIPLSLDGEGRLIIERGALVFGARLANPAADAIPRDPREGSVIDQDRDGDPGMSVVFRSGKVFGAFRVLPTATLAPSEGGRFAGHASFGFDWWCYGHTFGVLLDVLGGTGVLNDKDDILVLAQSHALTVRAEDTPTSGTPAPTTPTPDGPP